jgi:hypothetical protein
MMQKLLGLKPKLTARDLGIQFGCAAYAVCCAANAAALLVSKRKVLVVTHVILRCPGIRVPLLAIEAITSGMSERVGACGLKQQHCVRLPSTRSASWHS